MGMKPIALGIKAMILDAIHRHMEKHDGKPPKRIEMNPAVHTDFVQSLGPADFTLTPSGFKTFHNVEIVSHRQTVGARLITCENEVEYL